MSEIYNMITFILITIFSYYFLEYINNKQFEFKYNNTIKLYNSYVNTSWKSLNFNKNIYPDIIHKSFLHKIYIDEKENTKNNMFNCFVYQLKKTIIDYAKYNTTNVIIDMCYIDHIIDTNIYLKYDTNKYLYNEVINDIKKKINVIFPDIVTENYYLKNNNNIISNCTIYNFIW